jgi:beta-phosphoglucomutase
MIEAVIFDFDGVIADTMRDNCMAWKEAFSKYDFSMKDDEYYQLEGMGRFQIAEYFIGKYKLDKQIKQEVAEAKERIYQEKNSFRIYDHVHEIFALLAKKQIPTAIVTGASRERINEHMDKKIEAQLTALITADDVKNTKPDPEPYLTAVMKLGKGAGSCLVIENAILGIISAKGAGCKCFGIETTLKKEFLKEADEVFATHKDLLIKFESIF